MFKGNLSIVTSDHRPVIKYYIFSLRTICQNFDVKYIKPHKIKLLDVLPSDFHIYIYIYMAPGSLVALISEKILIKITFF